MTEQVGIALTVDMSQANREIDRTREKALSLGGAAERLDRASMKAAKGIGAMGPALGAMSRSSSEALRGLGDIAGLIGPGGGLAVGLTLTVGLVVKGYEAWKEYSENSKIAQQAIDGILPALNRMTKDGLQPGIDAVARLRKEFNELGKERVQIDREAQAALVESLEKQQETIEARLRGGIGVTGETGEQVTKILNARLVTIRESIESARQTYNDLVVEDLRRFGADTEAAERKAREAAGPGGNELADGSTIGNVVRARARKEEEEARKIAEAERASEWDRSIKDEQDRLKAERDAQADHERMMLDIERDSARERNAIFKEQANERKRIADDEKRQQVETARAVGEGVGGALATTANATAVLMAAGAEERNQIAAELLAAESVRAGGAISLKGAELVGTGAAVALGSGGLLSPLAAAQIAGGVALIGAGAAIAVGGPAAIPQLLGVVGGVGGSVGGGAPRDRGINTGGGRRRSRNSGEGSETGITQVTINYGVAGPTAEDQARELNRRNLLAERRRFS